MNAETWFGVYDIDTAQLAQGCSLMQSLLQWYVCNCKPSDSQNHVS